MESFFSRYRNPLVLLAVLLVQIIGLAALLGSQRAGRAADPLLDA